MPRPDVADSPPLVGGVAAGRSLSAHAGKVATALVVVVSLAACGGKSDTANTGTPSPAPSPTVATAPGATTAPTRTPSSPPHVLVIMEENKGYAATLGTCTADPYFCSLARKYLSFTNSHGVSHPSMPNYYAFISGATQGCASDGCPPFSDPSLGSQLDAAGVPWAAYMESMPFACDRGNAGGYVVKHDPFVQSTAISGCASHVLPYPGAKGMLEVLGSRLAPEFAWITPNLTNDMHDGSVQQGDAWLAANLKPILASPWFLSYPSTVIVTMDEGDTGSTNQIPTVIISSHALGIGEVSTSINDYAVLRAIEDVYALGALRGAASAPEISSFVG
ncbi:MAG: alkaline phosphatase family protein [Candidatus Dormiibacterota bacterium]